MLIWNDLIWGEKERRSKRKSENDETVQYITIYAEMEKQIKN